METFKVEREVEPMVKKQELIMQIKSLRNFYAELGIDSENIQRIFGLVIDYLEGKTDKMSVKAFFDTLVYKNKLESEKEFDLLQTFDQALDGIDEDFEKSDYQYYLDGKSIDQSLYQAAA